MANLIGVLNAPPIWMLGLAHALEASDYSLEELPTSVPPSESKRFSAVIVGIGDRADLDVVVRLREEDSNSVVITLLDELSVESAGASLRVGASSFVTLDSPANEVVLALEGALADRTVIPVAVARSLARSNTRRGDFQIPEEDLDVLKSLASGETVRGLGARLGYSEREMYRRLRRIYGRLGVSDRTDALLMLARLGLLD
jgi:DNA-binding NarL/FixJ family response regulator